MAAARVPRVPQHLRHPARAPRAAHSRGRGRAAKRRRVAAAGQQAQGLTGSLLRTGGRSASLRSAGKRGGLWTTRGGLQKMSWALQAGGRAR